MNDHTDLAIFTRAAQEWGSGRPLVLATVIGRRGSVPRQAGAKMLIWANGDMLGSVGGGCVEAEIRRRARNIHLVTHAPETLTVRLVADAEGGTGDVCGGQMDVFLDYIAAEADHARQ